jgi:hypothetical protein
MHPMQMEFTNLYTEVGTELAKVRCILCVFLALLLTHPSRLSSACLSRCSLLVRLATNDNE